MSRLSAEEEMYRQKYLKYQRKIRNLLGGDEAKEELLPVPGDSAPAVSAPAVSAPAVSAPAVSVTENTSMPAVLPSSYDSSPIPSASEVPAKMDNTAFVQPSSPSSETEELNKQLREIKSRLAEKEKESNEWQMKINSFDNQVKVRSEELAANLLLERTKTIQEEINSLKSQKDVLEKANQSLTETNKLLATEKADYEQKSAVLGKYLVLDNYNKYESSGKPIKDMAAALLSVLGDMSKEEILKVVSHNVNKSVISNDETRVVNLIKSTKKVIGANVEAIEAWQSRTNKVPYQNKYEKLSPEEAMYKQKYLKYQRKIDTLLASRR